MTAQKTAAQTPKKRDPNTISGDYAQMTVGGEFGKSLTTWLGLYLALTCALAIYFLISVWPYVLPLELDQEDVDLLPGHLWTVAIGPETRYLLISFFAGAIGSQIQAITSFVFWVGVGRSDRNWVAWYLLRPFVGGGLALGVYFALRGGFVAGNNNVEAISVYGVAAFSFMAGLFSRQAMDKLGEVFSTLFRTADKPKDNGDNGDPDDDHGSDEPNGDDDGSPTDEGDVDKPERSTKITRTPKEKRVPATALGKRATAPRRPGQRKREPRTNKKGD